MLNKVPYTRVTKRLKFASVRQDKIRREGFGISSCKCRHDYSNDVHLIYQSDEAKFEDKVELEINFF